MARWEDQESRLWSYVEKGGPNECWQCRKPAATRGYAQIMWNGHRQAFHRVVYELLIGPIASGAQLDHLCRNRLCCNPAHLEEVSPRENILRGTGPAAQNALRTHCGRGHEYVWVPYGGRQGRGRRVCNECRRIDYRER